MGMYQILKKTLTGSEKDENIPKNWSPNSVRSIVITRCYILIAFYNRPPKFVKLDMNESSQEIAKNGSTGALHNVLNKRQLSCLEEIYVDGIFKTYQGAFNLQIYVDSLVSTSSRLRYYGYTDDLSGENILNAYSNAQLNALKDYTYALDNNRRGNLEVYNTNNDDWYKKYNLRPMDYSADAERGTLDAWFKSVEKEMEVKYSALKERSEAEVRVAALSAMVLEGIAVAKNIKWLYMLARVIAKKGNSNGVDSILRQAITSNSIICENKIGKADLSNVLNKQKISPDDQGASFYLGLLKKNGCIAEQGIVSNAKELTSKAENHEELLGVKGYLKKIIRALGNVTTGSGKLVLLMGAHKFNNNAVKGTEEIIDWLIGLVNQGDIATVVEYLIYVAGYTIEGLSGLSKEV